MLAKSDLGYLIIGVVLATYLSVISLQWIASSLN